MCLRRRTWFMLFDMLTEATISGILANLDGLFGIRWVSFDTVVWTSSTRAVGGAFGVAAGAEVGVDNLPAHSGEWTMLWFSRLQARQLGSSGSGICWFGA